jgi:glycosyltransferase involved in cell wall biosynthesis
MSNGADNEVKDRPLISVIITDYNYGQYIAQAMRSVLAQTYQNIELIVINDGSTDDSDEVIKEVIAQNPDRNIRYVSRENKGVVYTRNEGLELARGEFICYLDADDYFNRSYISKSYRVIEESGADVAYPNWHFVGEWLGRPDTDFPEFKPELLQLQELHVTPASLTRKAAIGSHRFEVEKVAEDWDFFIGLSLDGVKFKLAKENHINYRIRKGTRGSKNDPREDTKYFVETLTKYKKVYGDKVINPNKLVRLRHPNIVMRGLNTRYPRRLRESIKKDGTRVTAKRVARKVVKRSRWAWRVFLYTRNVKYQKLTKSFDIVKSPNTKLAVILHLYYPDLWPVVKDRLKDIDVPFDLFVSVQERHRDTMLDRVSAHHMATNIMPMPNRGRDVLPFLLVTKRISLEGQYQYLLKLHSKKSPHRDDGSEWFDSLLSELIPSDISSIITTLEEPSTGVIGPVDHVVSLSRYMGANRDRVGTILESITDKKTVRNILENPRKYPYFGGTMFWCRVDFLLPVLNCGLKPSDFESEKGQVDGTAAHALERIFGKMLHAVTNKKMYVVADGVVSELPEKSYYTSYKYMK